MTTHYEKTLALFRDTQDSALAFGHSALIDLAEGHTIREISLDLCGNYGLEDKIGRWIMAARWDDIIKRRNGQLYEDARAWLTPSHFTVLWQLANLTGDKDLDFEFAHDAMEQCLVRNVRKEVTEVKPVDWLRAKLKDPSNPSIATRYHRLWRAAAKALPDAQSELERAGLLATKEERRRVRVLSMVVKVFSAEAE